MTIVEASEKALSEGVMLLRLRKEAVPSSPQQFDVKGGHTGKKRGWFYLDTFTASAIIAVYKALNEDNKPKYLALPLERLVNFTWRMVA